MGELAQVSDGQFALTGEINKSTVPGVVEVGWQVLLGHYVGGDVIIDLSGIIGGDSAALALLLAWQRRSRRHNFQITFVRFPEEFAALARVCGLNELFLTIEPDAA